MNSGSKTKKANQVICPRCSRVQPDMVLSRGRLYTEPGHALVIAYVCSGCERIICCDKDERGATAASA
jgi:hypothetical protein